MNLKVGNTYYYIVVSGYGGVAVDGKITIKTATEKGDLDNQNLKVRVLDSCQ